MMLPGRQHRGADQEAPAVPERQEKATEPVAPMVPDDHQQGDVQRGRLVERFVEAAKHGKHEARQAGRFRPHERCGQREQDEAGDGDELRCEIAAGQAVDPLPVVVKQQRQAVEQVDRPVGHDGPGDERDAVFPGEHGAADIVAPRRQPVGEAIGQVEERRQERQPQRSPHDHTAIGFGGGDGCGLRSFGISRHASAGPTGAVRPRR